MHDTFFSLIDGYSASCHSACSCGEQGFSPVCGADHIVYYSACHAGCSAKSEDSMVSIIQHVHVVNRDSIQCTVLIILCITPPATLVVL